MGVLFLTIPLTIFFMLFILPNWLWLHHNSQYQQGELSQNEQQRLAHLTDEAKKIHDRIQVLEVILDAEHPNWRDH